MVLFLLLMYVCMYVCLYLRGIKEETGLGDPKDPGAFGARPLDPAGRIIGPDRRLRRRSGFCPKGAYGAGRRARHKLGEVLLGPDPTDPILTIPVRAPSAPGGDSMNPYIQKIN